MCAQLRDMAMGAEGRAPLPVPGKLAEAWAEQVTTETGQPDSAPRLCAWMKPRGTSIQPGTLRWQHHSRGREVREQGPSGLHACWEM